MPSGETVLVTGGFGAIGSFVVRRLVQDGHRVVVYSRRENYGLVPELRGKLVWAGGDIEDAARLREVLQEHGVRRIVHMAAALPNITEREPIRGYQINLIGGLNLIEAVRDLKLERLVYASSKASYGSLRGEYAPPHFKPVTEDYVGQTSTLYGANKKALEDATYHYRRLWDVDVVGLRLGSTFGPGKGGSTGAKHVGYPAMKTHIIEASRRGEAVQVPWPEVADDIVYNGDVAKGAVLAAFAPKSDHWMFNISGNQLVSLRQFAEETRRLIPGSQITVLPPKPDDAAPASNVTGLLSIDRARAEIGYEPDYPGVKGIAAYLERAAELDQAAISA
jgi:nucleoside-diphosphate-sugar epimerase